MLIELFCLDDLKGLERGREERGLSLKLYVPMVQYDMYQTKTKTKTKTNM
jgi:hypothetical protein